MMNPNILSVVAVLSSLVAIAFALSAGGPENRAAASSEDLQKLEGEIDRLESRLRKASQLSSEEPSDEEAKEGPPKVFPPASLAEMRASQSRFEAKLQELGVIEHFETRQKKLNEAYEAVLDSEGEQWGRIKSLHTLREANRIDEAVVEAMMPLWADSFDDTGKGGDRVRWSLLENLRGSSNPEFRTNVLEWIGEEESSKMRGQGVQALIPMLPDPNVQEWLSHLSENDPEERIRSLATGALDAAK